MSTEFATIHIRAFYFAAWAILVYQEKPRLIDIWKIPLKKLIDCLTDFHGRA